MHENSQKLQTNTRWLVFRPKPSTSFLVILLFFPTSLCRRYCTLVTSIF